MPGKGEPGAPAGAHGADRAIAGQRSRSDIKRAQLRQWRLSRRARFRPDLIDFAAVSRAALARLPEILSRWLPGGRIEGREYVALSPRRADRSPGSFKINMRNGRWADFATGDKGGDPISLAAFLAGCSQVEAARRLAAMLGLAPDGR